MSLKKLTIHGKHNVCVARYRTKANADTIGGQRFGYGTFRMKSSELGYFHLTNQLTGSSEANTPKLIGHLLYMQCSSC